MNWRNRSEYKTWLLSLPEYEVVTWGGSGAGNFHANGSLYFVTLRGQATRIEILREGYPDKPTKILGQLANVAIDSSKYRDCLDKYRLTPDINLMTIYLKEKRDEY